MGGLSSESGVSVVVVMFSTAMGDTVVVAEESALLSGAAVDAISGASVASEVVSGTWVVTGGAKVVTLAATISHPGRSSGH